MSPTAHGPITRSKMSQLGHSTDRQPKHSGILFRQGWKLIVHEMHPSNKVPPRTPQRFAPWNPCFANFPVCFLERRNERIRGGHFPHTALITNEHVSLCLPALLVSTLFKAKLFRLRPPKYVKLILNPDGTLNYFAESLRHHAVSKFDKITQGSVDVHVHGVNLFNSTAGSFGPRHRIWCHLVLAETP